MNEFKIFKKSDYKMDGVDQLICCSVEGEVRGYKPMPSHMLNITSDRNVNQEAIRDMAQRKKVRFLLDFFSLLFKQVNFSCSIRIY